MSKRPRPYLVRTAQAVSNVVPIGGGPATPPRERQWRDLVRRLQRNLHKEPGKPA
jgi:hypothetical protein